jgi:glycosyltransferase involved in cell wall biosynthesis
MIQIAIPTYKRIYKLNKLLDNLLPEIKKFGDIFSVMVVDNDPEELLDLPLQIDRLALQYGVPIKYYRNSYNLGGSGNVVRCLELADSQWIWLLGDDDLVRNESLKFLICYLESLGSEVSAVKLSSSIYTNSDLLIKTTDELLCPRPEYDAYFSNLLFLSTWIFRTSDLSLVFRNVVNSVGGYGPQLFGALYLLKCNRQIGLSSINAIDWEMPQAEEKWDVSYVHYNLLATLRQCSFVSMRSYKAVKKTLFGFALSKKNVRVNMKLLNDYGINVASKMLYGSFFGYLILLPIKIISRLIVLISRDKTKIPQVLKQGKEGGGHERL